MTRQEQILFLNTTVKCRLKPSQIHGIGVFTIRPIKKGNRCFVRRLKDDPKELLDLTFEGLKEVDQDIREIILGRWPNIINGGGFYHPNDDARLLSFVNHSDKPNYNPLNDQALEEIESGTEITEDYTMVKNYKQVYPWLVSL